MTESYPRTNQLMEILKAADFQKDRMKRISDLKNKQQQQISVPESQSVSIPRFTHDIRRNRNHGAARAAANLVAAPVEVPEIVIDTTNENTNTDIIFPQPEAEVNETDNETVNEIREVVLPQQQFPTHLHTLNSNVKSVKRFTKTSYVWDAYWPFITANTAVENPGFDFENYYIAFNGQAVRKWSVFLPTPIPSEFPARDLFRLELKSERSKFNFDLKFENLMPADSTSTIEISPHSESYPLNVNQYLLQRDKSLANSVGSVSQVSHVSYVSMIAFYNTTDYRYNPIIDSIDNFDPVKNLLLSTQLFMLHINQIHEPINVIIAFNSSSGENLFTIDIETSGSVEIRESIQSVTNELTPDLVIQKKTVYVNGKYFMTHAVYANDIPSALQLGRETEIEKVIQLATQLIFRNDTGPVDISSQQIRATDDHQRVLIRFSRELTKI